MPVQSFYLIDERYEHVRKDMDEGTTTTSVNAKWSIHIECDPITLNLTVNFAAPNDLVVFGMLDKASHAIRQQFDQQSHSAIIPMRLIPKFNGQQ